MKNFYNYEGKAQSEKSMAEMQAIHKYGRRRSLRDATRNAASWQGFVSHWVKSLASEQDADNWKEKAIEIFAEMGIEAEYKQGFGIVEPK